MQLQARLVHAETGQRVVEVSAWREGACLGQALGEAATAEAAEDRAIARLRQRLPATRPAVDAAAVVPPAPPTPSEAPAATTMPPPPAVAAPLPTAEPPADPEDWSDELAEVELELRRLGWGRDQEAVYLERVFGHPSRSRLIRYADLLAYLGVLRSLAPGSDPASARPPLRRGDLLLQCEQLLSRLSWGAAEGRAFLEQHFGLASRQQLGDDDLLSFNRLLEEELSREPAPAAAAA